MSIDTLIHLALAVAQMTIALMIWHRAMPRILEARGRRHSICVWLLGMVLAVSGSVLLADGLADVPANWLLVTRDAGLAAYGFCRYRRSLQISEATWKNARAPRKEVVR